MHRITWPKSRFYSFPQMMLLSILFLPHEEMLKEHGSIRSCHHLLDLVLEIPIANLAIYSASELIVKQLHGEYSVKKAELIPYHNTCRIFFWHNSRK